MQRQEAGGVVISCDFCSTDWDQVKPMIEGHKGSVICLDCLKLAKDQLSCGDGEYRCVLCLREPLPEDLPRWSSESSAAVCVCEDCIEQATRAFKKDPQIDYAGD